MRTSLLVAVCVVGCNSKPTEKPPAPAAPVAPVVAADAPPAPDTSHGYKAADLALPGATPDGIGMDYLLFDPHTKTVWIPAGNTGSVDVIDAADKITPIAGFPTQEMERHGKKRLVGPSSATLGDGVVYIGNRGDSSVCAVDDAKLTKGTCGKLDSMPDGIAYVAKTKEVWVTTPRDKSIRILDGKTLVQKAKLVFDGQPEGFAVDATRGRFYTNFEDKDQTIAIDLASHKTVATWKPSCGEDGPHGLRLAEPEGFLLIACSTVTKAMDVGGGAILGTIDTGDGVDDLDYAADSHRVYIGAAKAAKLTIAQLDAKGAMTLVAAVPTRDGARNGVVDATGKVYLSHSKESGLVVVSPPP